MLGNTVRASSSIYAEKGEGYRLDVKKLGSVANPFDWLRTPSEGFSLFSLPLVGNKDDWSWQMM